MMNVIYPISCFLVETTELCAPDALRNAQRRPYIRLYTSEEICSCHRFPWKGVKNVQSKFIQQSFDMNNQKDQRFRILNIH